LVGTRGNAVALGRRRGSFADALHARHRQRPAGVDAADAAVRHRAEEQLAEQHAVDAEVLGVFRPARHLGDEIRGRVVVTQQFVLGHRLPPQDCDARD
jgi:hypothetical protein